MPVASSDGGDGPTRRRVLRAERASSAEAPSQPSPKVEEEQITDGVGAEQTSREPRYPKGRIRGLLDEQVAQSRDQAEHDAALELEQFMEPARQQLVLNVPGSSSPEEAEAILNRQAGAVLDKPVEVSPDSVVDLRNPSSMRAYPPAEKLSNRVLRLADRHWTKPKRRPSEEIRAEQAAINEEEFARKPAGTQRCVAVHGSLRCRGVFAYRSDEQADGSPIACPTCGSVQFWDHETETWVLGSPGTLGQGTRKAGITAGT